MEKALRSTSKTSLPLAILTSVISSFSFAATLCLSKGCLTSCSLNQISFFKAFFSMIPTIFVILWIKKKQSFFAYLRTSRIDIHFIRGLSGLITVYLFLLSLRTLSLAETTLLFNTTPLFVPLAAYIWKRTPVDHRIWPGLITAFLGLFFILHPQTNLNNVGLYFALLSGMLGAVTLIVTRLSHNSEPVFRTVFYYNTFSITFSGLLYLMEGFPLSHLVKPSIAFALLGVGSFGFLCQVFFTLSLKYAPAKVVAPLSYIAVIFGLGLDFIFWQVHITPLEFFGMILVLIGLYFVTSYLHGKKEEISSSKHID